MAGGNLSPRQKMINLMYLVLIAMLALNMSKEVLTAFGIMNNKFEEANINAAEKNENFLANLAQKAADEPQQYSVVNSKAKTIAEATSKFNTYLEGLKTDVKKPFEDGRNDDGTLNFEVVSAIVFALEFTTEYC
jgi:gliding motility-associated protein GldM